MVYLRENYFKFNFFQFFILLSLILPHIQYIYIFDEITLTIKGSGNNKKILSTTKICGDDKNITFKDMPDRIIINNETKNFSGIFINLTQEINTVKLQWDNPVTDCTLMFDRVYNIINFDFSKFDTSEVTDMRCMFCNSNMITSLDLTNFNTSLVTNMRSMFNKCDSLITLNISNFDTSKVTDLYHMFYNCTSLISVNVQNFKIISNANIRLMFENCLSLISLDLASFDNKMLLKDISGMFRNSYQNLILRVNTDNISIIHDYYPNFRININSSCFLDNHKIIKEKKDCIERCEYDNTYRYEYNNFCVIECPNGSFILKDNLACIEDINEEFYSTINEETYKPTIQEYTSNIIKLIPEFINIAYTSYIPYIKTILDSTNIIYDSNHLYPNTLSNYSFTNTSSENLEIETSHTSEYEYLKSGTKNIYSTKIDLFIIY